MTTKQSTDKHGTKSTPGSPDDSVRLDPWEELVGHLESIHEHQHQLQVVLSAGTLAYPRDSRAADILREQLADCHGARVAILRRPDVEQPLAVSVTENDPA